MMGLSNPSTTIEQPFFDSGSNSRKMSSLFGQVFRNLQ
jgi:hypothetical protein